MVLDSFVQVCMSNKVENLKWTFRIFNGSYNYVSAPADISNHISQRAKETYAPDELKRNPDKMEPELITVWKKKYQLLADISTAPLFTSMLKVEKASIS